MAHFIAHYPASSDALAVFQMSNNPRNWPGLPYVSYVLLTDQNLYLLSQIQRN